MLVKVHALLWDGERIVVNEERRQGVTHLTLPGGRVLDRERLEVALRREVEEEIGVRIVVGRLLYAAEVVHGHSVHDVCLIFAADAVTPLPAGTRAMTPAEADGQVRPPIMQHVAVDGPGGPPGTRWLGNLWHSRDA